MPAWLVNLPLPVVIWSAALVVPLFNLVLTIFVEHRKSGLSLDAERKRVRFARFHERQAKAVERAFAKAITLKRLAYQARVDCEIGSDRREREWNDDFPKLTTALSDYRRFVERYSVYLDGRILGIHESLMSRFNHFTLAALNHFQQIKSDTRDRIPVPESMSLATAVAEFERLTELSQRVLSGS